MKVYKDDCFDREFALLTALEGPGSVPWLRVVQRERADNLGNVLILRPRGEPLSADNITKQVLTDYLATIKYLHDNGYAHNDLRLPNLLVCKNGGSDFRGLVIDFGYVSKLGQCPEGGTRRAVDSMTASCEGDLTDFVHAINDVSASDEDAYVVHGLCVSAHKAAKKRDYDAVLKNLLCILEEV